MQPSEFRGLSTAEWWAEFDARYEANQRIEDAVEGAKPKGGGFSGAEWDDARRRHRERKGKT